MVTARVRARFREFTRATRIGLVLASAALGIAALLFFMNEEPTDPRVETATGVRETVVAVDDLEDLVRDKLDAWDVPERGTDRPLRVVASDVLWRDGSSERWLTVERVSASVRAGVLTGGAIVLADVDVVSPVIRLRQDANGQWNVAGVIRGGDGNGGDDGRARGGSAGVELRDIRVRGGDIALDMPGRSFEARRMSAVVPVARFGGSAGPSPYIRLASLDAAVSGAVPGPAQALSVREATLSGRADGVEFTVGRLALDESVVSDVNGLFASSLPDPGLRVRGHATHVDFADIHRLLPEFPETGVAAFDFAVDPLGAGRMAVRLSSLDVRSEGSHLAGMTTFIVGGETLQLGDVDVRFDPLELAFLEQFVGPLPYAGTLAGRVTGSGERLRFDVATNLRADGVSEPIIAQLQGEVALRGLTPDIRNLTASVDSLPLAALRGFLPGLPLRGVISGRFGFAGSTDGPLRIDATIGLPHGSIDLDGTVRLGAVPSYDLTGTLTDVRVREILAIDFPPVLLDARFTLVGTGTDPATADAALDLTGRFSGWQAGTSDLVAIDATLRGGTLSIERGAMRLATLEARVTGDWRLVEPATGALAYSVRVSSLAPFGPYLPGPADVGAGSFAAEGRVSGSLERIAFTSDLEASDLRYGEYAVRSLGGTVEYAAGDSLPRIAVDLEGTGVVTSFGAYETASADVTLDAHQFSGEIIARRPGGGDLELRADGRVGGPGDSDLTLRHALIDLGQERWTLTQPASIEFRPEGVVIVDRFAFVQTDGPGSLLVSGRVLPLDSADFRYDFDALPVGEIQRVLGRDPVLTGRLWAQGDIRTDGAPEFTTAFRIEDAILSGVPILRLEGTTQYAGNSLRLVATGALTDTAGTVEADVTFPLRLALEDSLDLGVHEAGTIAGRVRVDRFPVAVISTFTNAITEPAGSISGTVQLGGTIEAPSLDGALALNGVAFTIPRLDQRFQSIGGRVEFAGRRAELVDVVARAGGTANLSGSVVFEELDDPVLDVIAVLDAFEVMGAGDDDPAEVSGQVAMRGLVSAPVISGRVTIDNGTIDMPTETASDPFEEAELASLDESQNQTFAIEDLPGARPPAFGDVTIRGLVVDIEEDVTLAADQARARLAGELTVFHDRSGTRVFGTLQGNRGTFTLRAGGFVRIFEIREASIRFFGTDDLNPALDITATRTMGALDDPLELVVHVTGTLEHPQVQLATGDGAVVPESELLSVLVFGRPSFSSATQSTDGAVGTLLALGGVTDLASARLQEALAEDAGLPIDYVQLRTTGEADGGGNATTDILQNLSIALGTELYWDEVFLTVELPPARSEYWAAAVQWRIDREWTLELEAEPIIRRGAFGHLGLNEILGSPEGVTRQFGFEVRRRWTY